VQRGLLGRQALRLANKLSHTHDLSACADANFHTRAHAHTCTQMPTHICFLRFISGSVKPSTFAAALLRSVPQWTALCDKECVCVCVCVCMRVREGDREREREVFGEQRVWQPSCVHACIFMIAP